MSLNFAGCTHDEAWELIRHFDAWISRRQPDSVSLILDIGNLCYDPVMVMHCRKNMELYGRAVRKCAVLNASPFALWLIRHGSQVGLFSRSFKMSPQGLEFSSVKDAKAWLREP